jgi:hypothetical protein
VAQMKWKKKKVGQKTPTVAKRFQKLQTVAKI